MGVETQSSFCSCYGSVDTVLILLLLWEWRHSPHSAPAMGVENTVVILTILQLRGSLSASCVLTRDVRQSVSGYSWYSAALWLLAFLMDSMSPNFPFIALGQGSYFNVI